VVDQNYFHTHASKIATAAIGMSIQSLSTNNELRTIELMPRWLRSLSRRPVRRSFQDITAARRTRTLAFDMSGSGRGRSSLETVRSMERLGAGFFIDKFRRTIGNHREHAIAKAHDALD
jgi:hypothetical protein